MLSVKISILLWVAFFILRYLVVITMDEKRKMKIALGMEQKPRIIDLLFLLVFAFAIMFSVSSLIWFIFFK